jgi:L-alanine-DL-glutamate epimerase-like enolase superfamily enzyme
VALKILHQELIMVALKLTEPVKLAFLEFRCVPRVLFKLIGESGGETFEGIGEAAIDFPFVNYDLWDVYQCIANLSLCGRTFPNFSQESSHGDELDRSLVPTLPPLPLTGAEIETCLAFPAALTAVSMACDDLAAKAFRMSLCRLPAGITSSPMLTTIGFVDVPILHERIEAALKIKAVPKIKLGESVERDVDRLLSLSEIGLCGAASKPCLAADFNAAYDLREISMIVNSIGPEILNKFICLEQPLRVDAEPKSFRELSIFMKNTHDWSGALVADESVVTSEDALRVVADGWSVNYKMQKIGGIRRGLEIQKKTGFTPGMVGGTFPTAIGRAYDIQAASILSVVTLPSDAWQPSTAWFSDTEHLIVEEFETDDSGRAQMFPGFGLGVTPDWGKIESHAIADPNTEYFAIRSDRPAQYIDFGLRPGASYSQLYREKANRDPKWNLA